MNPWEKFKLKYPLGRIKYSIDGEYRGMIKLNSLNVLCGYVILPENHPFIGIDLYDGNCENPLYGLDVHGGVTFADYINEDDYAIGFDCGHFFAGDCVPRLSDFTPLAKGIWRDETYVINELKKLAEQLKEAELTEGGKDE